MSDVQVLLPPEEFAEDLELRLGRANGNSTYSISELVFRCRSSASDSREFVAH